VVVGGKDFNGLKMENRRCGVCDTDGRMIPVTAIQALEVGIFA
jgi:hypothetical protein